MNPTTSEIINLSQGLLFVLAMKSHFSEHRNLLAECPHIKSYFYNKNLTIAKTLTCFLLWITLGCAAPEPQPVVDADPTFATTDPSRLFFLNVRASGYYYERMKGQNMDLYRNRKFSQSVKRPILVPIIINAWEKHEAYLFVRPNKYPAFHDPLSVKWSSDTTSGIYTLDVPTRIAQFGFASHLYESIYRGDQLEVLTVDSTYIPIFEERTERAAFLGTVKDYYKLTERI